MSATRGAALVEINEPGAPGSAVWPELDSNGIPVLEPGEAVHAQMRASIKFKRGADPDRLRVLWEPDDKADVWITDRRVVYAITKYDKGAYHGAFTNSMTGAALKAVSRGVARARRGGKIAAGQVRYEWPVDVVVHSRLRGPMKRVGLFAYDCHASGHGDVSPAFLRVDFYVSNLAPGVETQLVGHVARWRAVARHHGDHDGHRAALIAISQDPGHATKIVEKGKGVRYSIPGATDVPPPGGLASGVPAAQVPQPLNAVAAPDGHPHPAQPEPGAAVPAASMVSSPVDAAVTDGVVVVYERCVPHAVPEMQMCCGATEMAEPMGTEEVVASFVGVSAMEGHAWRLGAGQPVSLGEIGVVGTTSVVRTPSRVLIIVGPDSAGEPAIWISAHRSRVRVEAHGTQGITKRPRSITLTGPGWMVVVQQVAEVFRHSGRYQTGQERAFLQALVG
ncbi:MAG: hypothetical protein U0U69_11980 [Acidimicrobiia bacterium]